MIKELRDGLRCWTCEPRLDDIQYGDYGPKEPRLVELRSKLMPGGLIWQAFTVGPNKVYESGYSIVKTSDVYETEVECRTIYETMLGSIAAMEVAMMAEDMGKCTLVPLTAEFGKMLMCIVDAYNKNKDK